MSKNISEARKKALEKQKKQTKIILLVYSIVVLIVAVCLYFFVYKPEEKRFARYSKSTFKFLQDELNIFYNQNGKKIYSSEGESVDVFCNYLMEKYSLDGNCNVNVVANEGASLTLKNGVEIFGFEKQPKKYAKTLYKDILIDTNGPKGKNEIGIDRLPLRYHSSGYIWARLLPVNCNSSDEKDYEMERSSYCPKGYEVNFLTTNYPLSFDAYQIDENKNRLKTVISNASFLRADCAAFGGDLLGFSDYCDKRGFYWLKNCYYDYECEIGLRYK